MAEPGSTEEVVVPERVGVDGWIDELIKTGLQELKPPQGMENRKFILVLRRADGNTTRKYVSTKDVFERGEWTNVNEVAILDILEETVENDEVRYKKVGWKDYRIARCLDGTAANGNRGSRLYTTYENPWPYQDNSKRDRLSKIAFKDLVSGYIDGLRVEDEYQGYGFGKLLAAVGVEVLKKIGVDEINFHGRLSNRALPIMKSLGHRPEVVENKTYNQPISEFSTSKAEDYIKPFIQKPN